MERPRYLTIFEDGTLELYDDLPQEVFEAYDQGLYQGLYDIVDMDTGQQWDGDGWVDIKNIDKFSKRGN